MPRAPSPLPPLQNPREFEKLCRDLWSRVWRDPNAQLNGRRGQRQNGVDVFGRYQSRHEGLQCKCKSSSIGSALAYEEITEAVEAAESFKPRLTVLTVVTTAATDARLQERVRVLSDERESVGDFAVRLCFWEEVSDLLDGNLDLLLKYYPALGERMAEAVPTATDDEIDDYLSGMARNIGAGMTTWVEPELIGENACVAISDLIRELLLGKSALIGGPSGAGKTFLVRYLVSELVRDRAVPIFMAAKHYRGHLAETLNETVGLSSPLSSSTLLKGCEAAGRRAVLLIDGVNELNVGLLGVLIGDVCRLKHRSPSLSVVLTTREIVDSFQALDALTLTLELPSEDQRHLLAQAYSVESAVVDSWSSVIRTRLDFKLAADVLAIAHGEPQNQYQFLLSYLQKRLESVGGELVFQLLRQMAAILTERVTWSLPESELLRLLDADSSSHQVLRAAVERSILTRVRGDLSFDHERFQHFFLAEHLLAESVGVDALADVCGGARYRDAIRFIISALADTRTIRSLLQTVSVRGILVEALEGHLGKRVEAVATAWAREMLRKVRGEILQTQIAIESDQGVKMAKLVAGTTNWTDAERRLLSSIGTICRSGQFLSDLLEIIDAVEEKCGEQLRTLGLHSKRLQGHVALQFLGAGIGASLLGAAYMFPETQLERRAWSNRATELLLPKLRSASGQSTVVLFLLCRYCREALWQEPMPVVAESIADLLSACSARGVYHLNLEAVRLGEAAGGRVPESEEPRVSAALREFLSEDPGLNSAVFEALSRYEEIDTGVSVEGVVSDIRRCLLLNPDGEATRGAAYIYNLQFEDLFTNVVSEALDKLESDELREFRIRAALGMDDDSFFVTCVLRELLEDGSTQALRAFEKWLVVRSDRVFFSDSIGGVFILAHLGFARLGKDLPGLGVDVERLEHEAWQHWGRIIYWLHRTGVSERESRDRCADSWRRLSSDLVSAAIDPWRWLGPYSVRTGNDLGTVWLPEAFPCEFKNLFEEALARIDLLTSLFDRRPDRGELAQTVFQTLGIVGDEATAVALEEWVESEFGELAVESIRVIRKRLSVRT